MTIYKFLDVTDQELVSQVPLFFEEQRPIFVLDAAGVERIIKDFDSPVHYRKNSFFIKPYPLVEKYNLLIFPYQDNNNNLIRRVTKLFNRAYAGCMVVIFGYKEDVIETSRLVKDYCDPISCVFNVDKSIWTGVKLDGL